MKAANCTRISLFVASCALGVLACGASGPDLGDLNNGGSGGSGVQPTGGSSGSTSVTGGSGGSAPTGGSTPVPTGGSAGSPAGGGAGPVGGSGGSAGDTGTGGTGGAPPTGPFAPRSGSFKMLVYSKTTAFRHDGSIQSGKTMLQTIAGEQGFEAKATETNEDFTATGLAQYEIVFFLNVTENDMIGVFTAEEKQAFDDWMTMGNGAYAGVHASTDGLATRWPFYEDMTGQNYNGHGNQNETGRVDFEAGALEHPAIKGLPNPWERAEEWYRFENHLQWSTQPGFQVLGRKQSDGQPIMWVREHATYRMFYTALGHDAVVFNSAQDTGGNMKKHLTGGIMWAVRREHCLATPRPATCPTAE